MKLLQAASKEKFSWALSSWLTKLNKDSDDLSLLNVWLHNNPHMSQDVISYIHAQRLVNLYPVCAGWGYDTSQLCAHNFEPLEWCAVADNISTLQGAKNLWNENLDTLEREQVIDAFCINVPVRNNDELCAEIVEWYNNYLWESPQGQDQNGWSHTFVGIQPLARQQYVLSLLTKPPAYELYTQFNANVIHTHANEILAKITTQTRHVGLTMLAAQHPDVETDLNYTPRRVSEGAHVFAQEGKTLAEKITNTQDKETLIMLCDFPTHDTSSIKALLENPHCVKEAKCYLLSQTPYRIEQIDVKTWWETKTGIEVREQWWTKHCSQASDQDQLSLELVKKLVLKIEDCREIKEHVAKWLESGNDLAIGTWTKNAALAASYISPRFDYQLEKYLHAHAKYWEIAQLVTDCEEMTLEETFQIARNVL